MDTKQISVHDYPRTKYSAYWEYFTPDDTTPIQWTVRFMSFDTHALLSEVKGESSDVQSARAACQAAVVAQMPGYLRKGD